MWQLILRNLPVARTYAYYITFPIAVVVGTAGYFLESKLRSPKPEIDYLKTSTIQQRQNRLNSDGPTKSVRRNTLDTNPVN